MVENHHVVGAGMRLQQGDHLGLIGLGDGRVVVKIGDGGRHLAELKPGVIKGQPVGDLAHVLNIDLMALQLERHLRLAAGQRGAFKLRFGRLFANEGQRRAQILARRGVGLGLGHGWPPVSAEPHK